MTSKLDYVQNAIKRVKLGEVKGSHTEGVFSRAASSLEQVVRGFTQTVLTQHGYSYEDDLRAAINGPSRFAKLTLGQIIALLQQLQLMSSVQIAPSLISQMKVVNEVWIKVKHGEGASKIEFENALQCIEQLLTNLEQDNQTGGAHGTD